MGDWEGRGLEWARAFALVSVRLPLLIPDGFFLVSPCVTLSLFFWVAPR